MISLEIHKHSLTFPKHEQYNGLADQMRRASKGICANLAEGFGKQSISKAEFKRFIAMAIGSADEMRVWLKYCQDLGYIETVQSQTLGKSYQEIAKMLTGLHKNWTWLLSIYPPSSAICPLNGRGAFCKRMKLSCEAWWTYQKCEC